ncbi:hypothetical protein [Palleronia caenipelagi]|uniref:Uncharacterized protein n=1 Tax=Palleronia caenipelagi TaxID=2489174 RepID=A0A547PM53_9RHOB|nr:hypothetical protein [Palleronia caenipelagi]TRD15225.1 hypothetical protein FEV53_17295 [Palleronia caenipelagi]
MNNFENIYKSIRRALSKRPRNHYLDVRVLVKVDRDNPIDIYAAERLLDLQKRFFQTPGINDRIIFRELPRNCDPVQFAIVDGSEYIGSNIQEEYFNEELDLILNTAAPGKNFVCGELEEEFRKSERLFDSHWRKCPKLKVPTSQISARRLKYFLSRFTRLKNIKNEREFQLVLLGYLQGQYDPSLIDIEVTTGATRIDLLIGQRPHNERIGIEVKFGMKDCDIHRTVGQMRDYYSEYEELLLVSGDPCYSGQRRIDLANELSEIGVSLIEVP